MHCCVTYSFYIHVWLFCSSLLWYLGIFLSQIDTTLITTPSQEVSVSSKASLPPCSSSGLFCIFLALYTPHLNFRTPINSTEPTNQPQQPKLNSSLLRFWWKLHWIYKWISEELTPSWSWIFTALTHYISPVT